MKKNELNSKWFKDTFSPQKMQSSPNIMTDCPDDEMVEMIYDFTYRSFAKSFGDSEENVLHVMAYFYKCLAEKMLIDLKIKAESEIEKILGKNMAFLLCITLNQDGTCFRPNEWISKKIRVDFLVGLGKSKVVVECDSFQYHHNPESFAKDKQRERDINRLGYDVFRFSGREIVNNPFACAAEVIFYLTEQENKSKKKKNVKKKNARH